MRELLPLISSLPIFMRRMADKTVFSLMGRSSVRGLGNR